MPNCTKDTFTKCYSKCETNGALQCRKCKEACSRKVSQDSGCFTYILEQDEQLAAPLDRKTIPRLSISSDISKYKMEPLCTALGFSYGVDVCKALLIPSDLMKDGECLASPSNSVVFIDIAGITGNDELQRNAAVQRTCIIEALKRAVASINTMGRYINGKSSHIRILLSHLCTLQKKDIIKPDFYEEVEKIVSDYNSPVKSIDIIGFSAPPKEKVTEKFKSLHAMKHTQYSTRIYYKTA